MKVNVIFLLAVFFKKLIYYFWYFENMGYLFYLIFIHPLSIMDINLLSYVQNVLPWFPPPKFYFW